MKRRPIDEIWETVLSRHTERGFARCFPMVALVRMAPQFDRSTIGEPPQFLVTKVTSDAFTLAGPA